MSVLRRILPGSSTKNEDSDDDYNVEYSFAIEYTGPQVTHEILQIVPIDVRHIPTASMAANDSNFSIPIIQPIVKSNNSIRKGSEELKLSASEIADESEGSGEHFGNRIYSRKLVEGFRSKSNLLEGGQSSSSSGTLGFNSDDHQDSNHLSSDIEDFDDKCKVGPTPTISDSNETSQEITSEISPSEVLQDHEVQGNRTSTVNFPALPSSDTTSQESDNDSNPDVFPSKPVLPNDDVIKGLCHKCNKRSRFADREICIVCGAQYCSKCIFRAMGSMPEGRKCITCIGYRIDESKRGLLGKCSRMMKKLLTREEVKQIMRFEMSCEVNQLPPHLICVNDKLLSMEELVLLQSCANPPKKLRPGNYWYDKVSGFWGKEGEKPCQIISAQLAIGYQILPDCSNGDTNVMINGRKITKPELWMLQAAGIHCEGDLHFWITADGSYQHEGMKNVMGKLWEKKRVKIVCTALSLPYPSGTLISGGEDVEEESDKATTKSLNHKMVNKFLLVGCDQSGTSTIFKQAKIVYNVPFSEEEKQNIKFLIQRNVYSYICVLLESHTHFEEDYLTEMRRQRANEPGPSGYCEQVDENNIYKFSPRLKAFADWLLQVMMSGNLGAIFPAATREYSPLVEELWKDKAFQATYKRRNELHTLPRVANYFLDRAVEISRVDYEPSQMDILYAEGITSSNGVASMEFSFPKSSQDSCMESSDRNDPPTSYQLIRVHASSLGEHCKWLQMFEDIDLLIYTVSLIDYDQYYDDDITGSPTNKMMATKEHFETIITHPTLAHKDVLLVLNKFDLLEEKIEGVPLSQCDWFRDFNPVIGFHPHNVNGNNNPPLAQRAFHYIAVKFKRLFGSLTGRKLFVSRVTGLEGDSVDNALRYGKEILKWNEEMEMYSVSMNELSTESTEPSTSM